MTSLKNTKCHHSVGIFINAQFRTLKRWLYANITVLCWVCKASCFVYKSNHIIFIGLRSSTEQRLLSTTRWGGGSIWEWSFGCEFGCGLYEYFGEQGLQWSSRSVLKDFTEDALTISAGSLFQNGTARMLRSLLVELSARLNTYPSYLNHQAIGTLRIRDDAAA